MGFIQQACVDFVFFSLLILFLCCDEGVLSNNGFLFAITHIPGLNLLWITLMDFVSSLEDTGVVTPDNIAVHSLC